MTSIIDRAAQIITESVVMMDERLALDIARRLADAGLLAPDLPEANDPIASFVPGGKGWLLDGPEGPVVWTAPGGLVMIQRIEPGELTPAEARDLASILNAAADHAEGVGRADA